MASKDEIAQILSATLSPDTNTRIEAELKLANAFAYPSTKLLCGLLEQQKTNALQDTGLELAQIALAQDVDISLRQICDLIQIAIRRVFVLPMTPNTRPASLYENM